jgi:hypothetical protein
MDTLLISNEDNWVLSKYKIRYDKQSGYYRCFEGDSKKYDYLHRIIIGAKKNEIVDHINRKRFDNRRENLRIVSNKLNNYNCEVKNPNGRGIYFDKSGNRYRACISHQNKTLKLGSFKNIDDAKKAYNKKAFELYGADAYQHNIQT